MIQRSLAVAHLMAAGLSLRVGHVHRRPAGTASQKLPAWTPPQDTLERFGSAWHVAGRGMTGVPLQRPEHVGERAVVSDEEFAERL
jgi:hypothetical protein